MLAVSPELLGVSVLPVGAARGSLLKSLVSLLVHASGLLTGGGKTAVLSVLVLAGADPVDARVSADGLVRCVNHDDLVVLETGILTNPVRVEDAEVGALASNTLLSNGLVSAGGLDLGDSARVSGLTVDATLGGVSLAATSADADTVNDVALLGLEANTAGLLGTRGSLALVDDGKLTVFPSAHTHDKADDFTLLLSPQLFKVLVSSHFVLSI